MGPRRLATTALRRSGSAPMRPPRAFSAASTSGPTRCDPPPNDQDAGRRVAHIHGARDRLRRQCRLAGYTDLLDPPPLAPDRGHRVLDVGEGALQPHLLAEDLLHDVRGWSPRARAIKGRHEPAAAEGLRRRGQRPAVIAGGRSDVSVLCPRRRRPTALGPTPSPAPESRRSAPSGRACRDSSSALPPCRRGSGRCSEPRS